ncbi:NLI interacting factor family phosphatase [Cardiosporidium cionae]|uniref:Mitochondrial import inner membrane translocase subunit TIM50 n=1 Tax=Cardiosporidium cionae TaxID=476202 RepID=A0ABQ7JGS3_9APIC|nr:NLI interacting factor family phosphatase [Cardiosporidium cionae]|eukprot:KAF8823124.1 NLI interacting factor family phosphatase [Cardiosporidium cionae]
MAAMSIHKLHSAFQPFGRFALRGATGSVFCHQANCSLASSLQKACLHDHAKPHYGQTASYTQRGNTFFYRTCFSSSSFSTTSSPLPTEKLNDSALSSPPLGRTSLPPSPVPVSLFSYLPVKSLLFLAVGISGIGYVYSVCLEKGITMQDFGKQLLHIFEEKQMRATDYISAFFDEHFPLSSEPLLPDTAELNYPDYLPTLVIDFDKTIAHLEHDRHNGWRVVKRPGADRFFRELIHYYEIVVWSDDSFPVAQDAMMKWGVPVGGCLHRDQCKRRHGHFIKDISRLGRKMDRVVMVDHDPMAYMLHPENGILIKEFNGDPGDCELESLIDLLKVMAVSREDVRTQIGKYSGAGVDIGRRYLVEKSLCDEKAENRRSLGKAFGMGNMFSPNRVVSPKGVGIR